MTHGVVPLGTDGAELGGTGHVFKRAAWGPWPGDWGGCGGQDGGSREASGPWPVVVAGQDAVGRDALHIRACCQRPHRRRREQHRHGLHRGVAVVDGPARRHHGLAQVVHFGIGAVAEDQGLQEHHPFDAAHPALARVARHGQHGAQVGRDLAGWRYLGLRRRRHGHEQPNGRGKGGARGAQAWRAQTLNQGRKLRIGEHRGSPGGSRPAQKGRATQAPVCQHWCTR